MRRLILVLALLAVVALSFRFLGSDRVAPSPEPAPAAPASASGPAAETATEESVEFPSTPARGPCELRGRVTWADGRPYTGPVTLIETEVFSYPDDDVRTFRSQAARIERERHRVTVPADAEGRFTCPGLRAGMVAVSVEVEGGTQLIAHRLSVPTLADPELVIARPAGSIEGRVVALPDLEPIPGARVEIHERWSGPGFPALGSTRTDDGGWFSAARPEQEHEIVVTAKGFTPLTVSGEDNGSPLTIRLSRSGAIHGRVVDGGGAPAAGITISVEDAEAVSDGNGAFVLEDVPAGWQRLSARGNELLLADAHAVEVEPGETATVTLVVTPGVIVTGVVRNDRSEPVVHAEVLAGDMDWSGGKDPLHTRTDEHGAFTFPALMPDRNYWIRAAAQGLSPGQVEPVHGGAGETRTVRISLDAAKELPVRVVTADTGEPVFGAEVVLLGEDGKNHEERTWLTDAAGLAHLTGLPAGAVWLDVRHQEHPPLQRFVHYSGRGAGGPLTIRLEPCRSVVGRVVPDRPAGPITGLVRILEDRPSLYEHPGSEFRRHYRRSVTVHPDGSFRIAGLPAERAYLTAEVRIDGVDYEGSLHVEPGTVDAVIPVKPEHETAGEPMVIRVVDPGGVPVPQASVYVQSAESRDSWWARAQDGVATARIPPDLGPFTIQVSNPRNEQGDDLPLGPVTLGPIDFPSGLLEVRLPPGKSISGTLTGPDGAPLPRRYIDAWQVRSEEEPGHPDTGGAVTDASGTFMITGLGTGDYQLHAFVDAEQGCDRVTVPAGATDVRLVARPIPPIRIEVLDPEGMPVPGLRINVLGNNPRYDYRLKSREMTDSDGVAILRGCEADTKVTLEFMPPQSRPELVPLTMRGWLPKDDTIRLQSGLFIRGRIEDLDGGGLVGVVVTALWEDSRLEATPFHDGTFEIGPLPDREVKLVASPDLVYPGDRVWTKITVRPGTDGVVLPYERLLLLTMRVANHGLYHQSDSVFVISEQTGMVFLGGLGTRRISCSDLPVMGSYTLLARCRESGTCVRLTGLRPGTEGLEVTLVPGGEIKGTLLLPADATEARVFAQSGEVSFPGRVEEGGAFTIHGLPPGDWDVRATCVLDHERITRWARAALGKSVTIDLR